MNKGMVYIVGAGPGSKDLITVKALRCIQTADVVVYDELGSAEFLGEVKGDAELIYVGKKAGDHAVAQDKIEDILIKHASAGKTVCRLKGGDPFVFGRGGEEVINLAKHNIQYEVVPGVTSAISAPAYAGIPVTQRGYTSGVAFFTGHEDPTKETSDLDFETIAKLNTTLVFLMGMKNLPTIVSNLSKYGMSSSTPVAVVHRGTTPFQKTVTGTITTIVDIVEKESIKAPSIIVVGDVVKLRENASWFETLPLFGKKILVTRTRKQASALVEKLGNSGAATFEFPTIEIEPIKESYSRLDSSIKEISDYDWLIFTSTNSVEIFMDRMQTLGLDGRQLKDVKICAIGSSTSSKLKEYFIDADLVPKNFVAESMLESLKGKVSGKKILLPRADLARNVLPDGLKADGADVDVIDLYKTTTAHGDAAKLKEYLDRSDLITFTSSSTVDNFVKIMGSDLERYKTKINAATIGPITTNTAKDHGLNIVCEAKEYTINGLVDVITEYYQEKK